MVHVVQYVSYYICYNSLQHFVYNIHTIYFAFLQLPVNHSFHLGSFVKLILSGLKVTLFSLSNFISTIPSHNIQSAGIAPLLCTQSNIFSLHWIILYALAPSYQFQGCGFSFIKAFKFIYINI